MEELRRNYQVGKLEVGQMAADPVDQFLDWFEQVRQAELPEWFEVNAMTLSSVDGDGRVSGRIVLLKQCDRRGFTFFTNYRSDKGQQLEQHPQAALSFYWPHAERQVRVEGVVERTSPEESDQYFGARPLESQLGAIVSPQSQVVDDSQTLIDQLERLRAEHAERPPQRPQWWGGYRLSPRRVEFWQGRPGRLHDRLLYVLQADGSWLRQRLAP
jgi:pyridoxamine 5'-phosphate oxidase